MRTPLRLDIAILLFVCASVLATPIAYGQVADLSIDAMPTLEWQERAPGVWLARIGEEDSLRLSDFAAAPPKRDALAAMQEGEFPFEKDDAKGSLQSDRASLRIPLSSDERLWGLGLQFRGTDRRSSVYHLRVDHYGESRGRTHAPVPLYVSSKGYAVFFNTARFLSLYPGIGNRKDNTERPTIRDRNTDPQWSARPRSSAVEASVRGSGLEVIVFAGPTALDAIRRYNLYFGGGVLPPRWGLGFWHRTPTNATATDILEEVARFEADDFPLDVIGLEPGWQSASYPGTFDWNEKNFPDPKGFIGALANKGIRVNLWENPYVSPRSSMYEALKPYTASHMVWLGEVPDFTMEETQKIVRDHHGKTHIDLGVSGYKIDEVDGIDEWLWPDHAQFPSGHSGELMRQTYGLQVQQTLYSLFRERNQRTYSLVRGSNGAASGYPFVLYSDYYNHRGYVNALASSGFAGVLWTPEIRSARTEEEWVRRMQTVCLSHLAQLNAWASGTKPWSMPEVNDAIRSAMKLRMRLIPYLYTAFAAYHFEGTPPIRSMLLEQGYPQTSDASRASESQFMIGDDLMAAPMIAGDKERAVYFPSGKWYDFFTGDHVADPGQSITISPALDEIPLYVRGGSLIPLTAEAIRNTDALGTVPALEIRHYGNEAGEGRLYWDDGHTFDYERGSYAWYHLETDLEAEDVIRYSYRKSTGALEFEFEEIEWRVMTRQRLSD